MIMFSLLDFCYFLRAKFMFGGDLDIGERLYARNTAASIRKRSNTKNTQVLEAAWSNFSEQGIDVKAEVDRMFGSIMESIERDPSFAEPSEEVPTRRFGMVLDATTNSRIAATQALMSKNITSSKSLVYHNTFGSGRSKMSAPVQKTDAPGPGQYYPHDDVYASIAAGRCSSASGRSTQSSRVGSESTSSSTLAKKAKRGFSFGTGKRSTFEGLVPGDNRAKQLSVPGPGEYKVPSAFECSGPQSKKGTFSTAKRSSSAPKEVTPGPGTYALDQVRAKVDQLLHDARPSPAFNSTSARMPSPRSQAPGPGTYHAVERGQSPPPVRDTPMYSFPKALPKQPGTDAPGPGTYDLTKDSTMGQYRGGIPSAGRDDGVWGGKKKLLEPAPGPGTYNPPIEQDTALPVTLKFRYDERANSNPGPGQYDFASHEKPTGPLWSLTSRPAAPEVDVLPGPADYQIETAENVARSMVGPVFGVAKRDTHEEIQSKLQFPGPGDYQPEDPSARKIDAVVFGTQKQRPEKPSDTGPGPGEYNPDDAAPTHAPILHTTAQRFMPSATDIPGPGYYDAIATALVQRSAVIGDAKRNTASHFEHEGATAVGPGEYELPALDAGRMHSMGLPHIEVLHVEDTMRGPGAYSVGGEVGTANTAVIGSAARFPILQEEKNAALVPGPGAYDPMRAEADKHGAIFGTSSKEPPLSLGAPVGPGAYDPQEQHRPNMPSFTVGTSLRFDRQREAMPHPIPGPGSYEPTVSSNTQGIVFGTSKAHEAAVPPTDVPGPGSYDVSGSMPMDPRVKNPVLGSAPQRVDAVVNDAPGPAHYEPQPIAGHIQTPYINSRPIEKVPETPGPGLYYLTNIADPVAPSAVFGSSAARQGHDYPDVPGPGAYALPVLDEAPSIGIPQGPRFPSTKATEDVPGPGSYSLVLPVGPAFTVGTAVRAQDMKDNGVPGPGAYHPSVLEHDGSGPTIGGGSRFADPSTDIPGPGAYSPQSMLPNVHSYVFGDTAARPGHAASNVPGPGAYEWMVGPLGPSVAFPKAARIPRDPREDIPGPGYYYVQTADGAPQVRFLTAPRLTDLATHKDVPGPGQYDVPLQSENAGFSFSNASPRPAPKNDAPGPGAYELKSSPSGPSYTFGLGPQHDTMGGETVAPGPGAYDAVWGPEGPSYSFGKLSREQIDALHRQQNPGPGAYDIRNAEVGPAYTVGTAPRPNYAPALATPGPGSYAPTTLVPESFSYSVPKAGRFPASANDALPGPGAYDLEGVRATNMLGSVMGTAGRETRQPTDEVPGPGYYDPRLVGQEGPVFSMNTKSVRFISQRNEVPGPASYEPQNPSWAPSAAPSVGTAQRFYTLADSDLPGPGAYDFATESNAPAVSFAMAQRPFDRELKKRAMEPGPGHYDPNLYAAEGPAFTFGSARADPTSGDADLPGPGQYTAFAPFGSDAPAAQIRPLPMVDQDAVFAKRVNAQPGPNAYNLPSQLDPRGAGIGSAPRDPTAVDDRLQFPGPGAYVTGGVGMFDGPKYSIPKDARDTFDKKPGDNPGPGAYDGGRALDRVLPGAPAYSIPLATRGGDGDGNDGAGGDYRANLGPGAYNVGPAPHAGPAYSIPQAADFMGNKDAGGLGGDGPGPGMYHNPARWGDGGFTMGGKPQDRSQGLDQVPGPGYYRLHDHDPYGRDKAIGIDFSRGGERPCNVKVENVFGAVPGPGYYHRGDIQFGDGRGVSILQKIPERFSERTPGPPDYHHPVMRHPFFDPLSH